MGEKEIRTEFERIGTARVRDQVQRGAFNEAYRGIAVDWLSERDAAEAKVQLRIMRSAKNAAWAAAIAAFAAVAVALFSFHR